METIKHLFRCSRNCGLISNFLPFFMIVPILFMINTALSSQCSTTISTFPVTDDFEVGSSSIDWIQDASDDFDWTLDSGGTTSSGTGPSSGDDGSEYYMYTEASNPNSFGSVANLISPCISSTGDVFLDFSYHMYSTGTIGTFKIDVKEEGESDWTTVWSKNTNQGNQWNNVSLKFDSFVGSNFQFRFSVTTNTFKTDIAIDNITITQKEDCNNGIDDNGNNLVDEYDPFCSCIAAGIPNIDFNRGPDGQALAAGTLAAEVWAPFGIHISTADVPSNFPPMIFDSQNPTGGDVDLGTPNSDFGGPGHGPGGETGQIGANDKNMGNVLIVSTAGQIDDYASGGKIIFDFDQDVDIASLEIIDFDYGSTDGFLQAYDASDNLILERIIYAYGDNSYQKVNISASGVRKLVVTSFNSFSIAELNFCDDELPLANIGDLVWLDVNSDGVSTNEKGLPDIPVLLYDANSNLLAETRTDSLGYYLFENLSMGEYRVSVDPPSNDYIPTYDLNGGNDNNSGVFDLGNNEDKLDVDFGLYIDPCEVFECVEICDNGIDDDGDGQIDCLDGDCSSEVVADAGLDVLVCPCIDSLPVNQTINPFLTTLDFNAFVKEKITVHGGESEGGLAVGGDFIIDGQYNVGIHSSSSFIAPGDSNPTALLIGGKIKYVSGNQVHINQNGYVKLGDVTGSVIHTVDNNGVSTNLRITEGAYNATPSINSQIQQPAGTVNQSGLINFDSLFVVYNLYSEFLAEQTDNATIDNSGNVTLSSNEANFLSLTGAEFNALNDISFSQNPSLNTPLIINISHAGEYNFSAPNFSGTGGTDGEYIILNFVNSSKINISGSTIYGTVFAPTAEINKSGSSNINGQVISRTFDQISGELHYFPFSSNLLPNNSSPCDISLTASGGESYIWSTGSTDPLIVVAPAETTIYSVTVTGSNGCTSVDEVEVAVNTFVPDAGEDQTICEGESTTLTASGGGTYLWSNGSTNPSITVSPIATTTYSVTITSTDGCESVETNTVTVGSNPSVSIDFNGSECLTSNSQLTANATGGSGVYTYDWSGPNSFTASTQTISITQSGNYNLTITDSNGCTAQTSGFVYSEFDPFIFTLTTQVCEGTAVDLSVNGNGSFSYAWDANAGNSTSNSVTVFPSYPSSDYVVTVTNAEGCQSTALATINVLQKDIVTVTGSDILCVDETTTLSPSSGGDWQSLNTNIATVTPSGVVTAVGSGSVAFIFTNGTTGCVSDATLPITIYEKPNVSISGPSNICENETTSLSPSSGGIWYSSNESIATVNSSGVVTPTGTGSVSFTFKSNATGCISNPTAELEIYPVPVLSVPGSTTICVGSTVAINSTVNGTWSGNNNGVASISSGGIVTGHSAGTATFTIQSTNGCSPSETIDITVDDNVVTNISGSNMLCEGEMVSLIASHTGGTWSSNNQSIATINTNGVVTGVNAGTTTIEYSFSGSDCIVDASFEIEVKDKPTVNITGSAELCVGESSQLSTNLTGGFWTSNNTNIATVNNTGTVVGISAGSTSFFYTSSNGCESENSGEIVVNPSLDVAINFHGSICLTENSQLSTIVTGGTSGYTYQWAGPGGFTASTDTIDIVLDGNYYVTVTDSKGCAADVSAFIYEEYEPFIFALNTTVCEGEDVTLSVNGQNVSSYAWGSTAGNSTSQSVVVIPSVPSTSYSVTVTNTIGCTTEATADIAVDPKPTVSITGQEDICVGETSQLSPSTGGIWSSSNSTVATVTNTGLVTGNSNGSAVFTFKDNQTGCVSESTNPITVVSNAPITLMGDNTICFDETPTITTTILGGVWSTSNTNIATIDQTGKITPISQGNVTILYNVSGDDCYEEGEMEVSIFNDPTLTLNGPSTICEDDNTFANASASGTWTSSNTNIATISNTGVITGVAGGTVTISFESNVGCTAILATDITVIAKVPVSLSGPSEICENGTTTLSPSTGGIWISSNNNIASVGSNGVVTGKNAGTATFSFIESSNGCLTDETITVTVHGPPTISGLSESELCIGESSSISPSTGGTWTSTDEDVATIDDFGVITAVGEGSARFVFTNSETGCSSSLSAPLTVNGRPVISFTGLTSVCKGESSSISPTSGGQWSSSNVSIATISANGTITAVNPGTVYFTFTSSLTGCNSGNSEPFVVKEPTEITLSGPSEICVGSSTNLLPNSGGSWSSSNPNIATISNTGVVTGHNSGLVTFVFDSNTNCSSDPSIGIEVKARPNVSFTGPTGICIGSTTNLSPTSGGVWTSSNTDVAIVDDSGLVTSVGAGSAEFTFTETLSGCDATIEASLSVYEKPVPEIIGDDEVCIGFSTYLTPSTGGIWSSSNTSVAVVTTTGQVTGVAPGTASFTFFETGSTCVSEPSSPITVLGKPQVVITGSNTICVGSTTTVSPSTGGAWISDNENVATITESGVITGVSQGIAKFTFVSDAGCASNKTSPVIVYGPPSVSIDGPNEVCIGEEVQMLPSSGGIWISSNEAIATIDNNGVVTTKATGNVYFTFEDSNTGCISLPSEELIVNSNPDTGLNGPSAICIGGATYLTPSTGGIWLALDPEIATIQNNGLVTGVTPGTPRFQFTNLNTGCQSEINLDVEVITGPPIDFDGPTEICEGDSTSISSNGLTGQWVSTNDLIATVSDAGIIHGISAGSVRFQFEDSATGCTSELSDLFTVNGPPTVSVGGVSDICIGSDTYLVPSTGGTWESLNTSVATVTSDGIVTGVAEGEAFFIFTDEITGCESDGTLKVNVEAEIDAQITGESEICTGYTTTLFPSSGGVWTSSNTSIATVSNSGVVTGKAPGIVTFTFVDSNTGCSSGGTTDPIIVTNCINPDFNVALVNQTISGNLNTNDNISLDATYSNVTVTVEKPLASLPQLTINSDGTYTFTTNKAGKYLYKVSVCLPPSISGCPSTFLEINVLDNVYGHSNPISNLEFATTYANADDALAGTPVVINPISNDDCVYTVGCDLDDSSLSIVKMPNNGSVVVSNDGTFSYTPDAGFIGHDTIDYEVCVLSESSCSKSMQIITVNAPNANNSVVAADDFAYTLKGVEKSGNLLTNDIDPEGDDLTATQQGSMMNPVVIAEGEYFIDNDGSYSFTPNDDFSGALEIVYTVCDDNVEMSCTNATLHLQVFDDLSVNVRVYLEGSLMANGNELSSEGRPLMRDGLRNSPHDGNNHIPVLDPYSNDNELFDDTQVKFTKIGPGLLPENMEIADSASVFSVTGENAIVDWVFIELRDKDDYENTLATRSGLLQRDGDIVDLDGVSALRFQGTNIDSFYVVVRHRTHLGVMSEKVGFGSLVDFTSTSTPTFNFGVSLNNGRDYTGLSQKGNVKNGYYALWAGDFNSDGLIKFTEPASDINILFGNVLFNSPGFLINYDFAYGYFRGDFNMDGKAKYANPNDDRNFLQAQIIFHPLNTNFISNLDGVIEQIPGSK